MDDRMSTRPDRTPMTCFNPKHVNSHNKLDPKHHVGVAEAVMIQNLAKWIMINQAKQETSNWYDGSMWSYRSYERWATALPWWSENQIRTIMDNLRKDGIIKVVRRRTHKRDVHLYWYTFVEDGFEEEWMSSNRKVRAQAAAFVKAMKRKDANNAAKRKIESQAIELQPDCHEQVRLNPLE